MPASRYRSQQTLQTFGEISRFLREDVADEDSRQLRDSLSELSRQIDDAMRIRRVSTGTEAIMRRVVALERCTREHQLVLTGMGSSWHTLYEFSAYQHALRELHAAILAWQDALETRSPKEKACFDLVDLLAWRTLGEALLLLDIYEHGSGPLNDLADAEPRPRLSLFQRLRAWLRRWRG